MQRPEAEAAKHAMEGVQGMKAEGTASHKGPCGLSGHWLRCKAFTCLGLCLRGSALTTLVPKKV